MSSTKIITVFGATGLQGGSVVTKFLNDPELKGEWTVRAVTRDVSKPSALKLAEQGAEVVAVSLAATNLSAAVLLDYDTDASVSHPLGESR
jgi:uncharacterized protein YbjT (DUF2867 family)